jgi:hypothetical protein
VEVRGRYDPYNVSNGLGIKYHWDSLFKISIASYHSTIASYSPTQVAGKTDPLRPGCQGSLTQPPPIILKRGVRRLQSWPISDKNTDVLLERHE